MRHSSQRHNVARLRTLLGIKQDEFAKLVGCSLSTIQSIEVGPDRLALSERLAIAISQVTGVDPRWLLDNDENASPRTVLGVKYTKGHYEAICAQELGYTERVVFTEELLIFFGQLTRLVFGLVQHQPDALRVVYWKMRLFREELFREFGTGAQVVQSQQTRDNLLEVGKLFVGEILRKEDDPAWRLGKFDANQEVLLEHHSIATKDAKLSMVESINESLKDSPAFAKAFVSALKKVPSSALRKNKDASTPRA